MKEIDVTSYNVPATGRSKNYRAVQATTATGGGAATPSVTAVAGGAADTAKVAQNLSEDSTDWAKILRRDMDQRTEFNLSVGKDLTVDGKATINDVQANTGTFAGLLKAASATIVGGLVAATVNATTINATTFIGELQGNAATATQLKNTRKIFGIDFNGSSDVNGLLVAPSGGLFYGQGTFPTNVGPYVLNYVSSTYGSRVLAYDGINYQKLSIGKLISGTNFQLELNTDGTSKFNGGVIASGMESSKGGLFYGQYSTMPTGLGTYVANYVSDAYGARILAYDGASYKDLKLGSMPTAGIFGMTLQANGDTRVGYNIGTSNFASHTSGWQVNAQGAADFRNIYADELRVQAFTADISQALAGSDYLTKSVSKLSSNFVIPAVGSSVRIIVDDLEGMPATRCFANGDYIRFRAINRTSGLSVSNAWGTVVLDTTFGTNGFSNGTQAYTFTCTATSGAGLTVFKGSEVLDYGVSGSGLIARTTLDAMGSPYEQIATWNSDPSNSNNYTVHARLGNLGGIANCSGHGLYTDNGYFTGNIVVGDLTKNNNFLSFSSASGLQIKLGGYNVATTNDTATTLTSAKGYTDTQITAVNGAITAEVNNRVSAINAIKIGGRNIIPNTNQAKDWNISTWNGSASISYVQFLGVTAVKATVTAISTSWLFLYKNNIGRSLIKNNYNYTISFDCLSNTTTPIAISIMTPSATNAIISFGNVALTAGVTTHVSLTALSNSETATNQVLYIQGINKLNYELTIANLKLEEGNKTTTWTPAPEDVDASIALKVAQTDYNAQVTIFNTSINSKVSQTDFNALGQRVGTAESTISQQSTDIGLKVSKDGVIGAINLTSEAATINASKINLVGAVTASSIVSGAVTTDKLAAKAATIDKIDTASLTASQAFIDDFNANIVTTKKLDVVTIVANGLSAQTIDAQNATINNLSVNNGTIYNLRGPWTDAPLNLTSAQSDNMVMPGNGVGSYHWYSLEWTVNHIGRKITLAGPEGLENGRRYGGGYIQAPSGKFFYLNGNKKTELYVENQIIELIGYGRNDVFYGWVVTNMTPLMDTVNYGSVQRVLVQGYMIGTSTGANITAEHIFNNGWLGSSQGSLSVSRMSQGIYRITFPTAWGLGLNYMVMLTGYGHSAEDAGSVFSPIKATLKTISDGYFEVATSDDASVNDGSFEFQMFSLNEVNY